MSENTTKPYKATSLSGVQREVRMLRKQNAHLRDLLDEAHADRVACAKLAAEGPAFDNPLVIVEAKRRRDVVLKHWCKLAPDGRPL